VRLPIKIMGQATDEFRSLALGIVSRHFGTLAEGSIEERRAAADAISGSRSPFEPKARAQLDAVYTELTSCRQVLVAL